GCTHVGLLLFAYDVDVHVFVAGVLPHHHATIDFSTRLHEEFGTFLQVDHRIRGGRTGAVRNYRAAGTVHNVACPGRVAAGVRRSNTGASGFSQEACTEADESTCWNFEVHANPAGAVVDHVLHDPLARSHQLRDGAQVLFWQVNGHDFHRLVENAVDFFGHNLWFANGEFETFAAHLLYQDRQCQFTTSLNLPGIWAVGWQNFQRDVADQFTFQTIFHLTRCHLGTLDLAGKW